MQNLIAFLAKYYHWLLFLVLEVVSVVLLFRYNGYQGSLWISTANSVAGQVYDWQAEVEQFFTMKAANRQLATHNVVQAREIHRLREKLRQMQADSVTIAALASDTLSMVEAQVVSADIGGPNNLLTINRGRADGIAPDMGVVCGEGIVGVVYMAGEHYSVVLPVLNRRSRISCGIQGRDYFGYLVWTGGDTRYAYVEGMPRHARFERGELMQTNGYSAIFPPGFTVGRIIDVQNSPDGLSYRLRVALATDFSSLRDVCVITDRGFIERRRLEASARDSLEVRGFER